MSQPMTTAELVADLKEEAAGTNLWTLAELTDADLQHAIDTVGADFSVADLRKELNATGR